MTTKLTISNDKTIAEWERLRKGLLLIQKQHNKPTDGIILKRVMSTFKCVNITDLFKILEPKKPFDNVKITAVNQQPFERWMWFKVYNIPCDICQHFVNHKSGDKFYFYVEHDAHAYFPVVYVATPIEIQMKEHKCLIRGAFAPNCPKCNKLLSSINFEFYIDVNNCSGGELLTYINKKYRNGFDCKLTSSLFYGENLHKYDINGEEMNDYLQKMFSNEMKEIKKN